MRELSEVNAELDDKITKIIETGNRHGMKKEHLKALEFYSKAWDLLPEPKKEWEMLSSWLASCFSRSYLNLKNFEEAVKWAEVQLETCGSDIDTGPLLALGMAQYENNEKEKSWENFHLAYNIGKKRAFQERPVKYLNFYLDILNKNNQ